MMNKLKYAMWSMLLLPSMLLSVLGFLLEHSLNAVTWVQVWLLDKCISGCEKYENAE